MTGLEEETHSLAPFLLPLCLRTREDGVCQANVLLCSPPRTLPLTLAAYGVWGVIGSYRTWTLHGASQQRQRWKFTLRVHITAMWSACPRTVWLDHPILQWHQKHICCHTMPFLSGRCHQINERINGKSQPRPLSSLLLLPSQAASPIPIPKSSARRLPYRHSLRIDTLQCPLARPGAWDSPLPCFSK